MLAIRFRFPGAVRADIQPHPPALVLPAASLFSDAIPAGVVDPLAVVFPPGFRAAPPITPAASYLAGMHPAAAFRAPDQPFVQVVMT